MTDCSSSSANLDHSFCHSGGQEVQWADFAGRSSDPRTGIFSGNLQRLAKRLQRRLLSVCWIRNLGPLIIRSICLLSLLRVRLEQIQLPRSPVASRKLAHWPGGLTGWKTMFVITLLPTLWLELYTTSRCRTQPPKFRASGSAPLFGVSWLRTLEAIFFTRSGFIENTNSGRTYLGWARCS